MKSKRSAVLINLCIALIVANIIFLAGSDKTQSEVGSCRQFKLSMTALIFIMIRLLLYLGPIMILGIFTIFISVIKLISLFQW